VIVALIVGEYTVDKKEPPDDDEDPPLGVGGNL